MRQIQEAIDKYIAGELNRQQVDSLWKIFLTNPHWCDYFITVLHFNELARRGPAHKLRAGLSHIHSFHLN